MTTQERDRLERDAEKFRELEQEIDRLKEQVAEAVRLFTEAENHWDDFISPERRMFLNEVSDFLAQNSK